MKRKLTVLVLLGLAAGAAYWTLHGNAQTTREDASLIFDRAWVDSIAGTDKTQFVRAFLVVKRLPVGIVQKASRYRLEVERFSYKKIKDGKLALIFPQTGKKASITYTIETCDDLPDHDLCLNLSSNPWGGPTRYFGKRARKRGSLHQALGLLAQD